MGEDAVIRSPIEAAAPTSKRNSDPPLWAMSSGIGDYYLPTIKRYEVIVIKYTR
jgi:hypothetical protein